MIDFLVFLCYAVPTVGGVALAAWAIEENELLNKRDSED